MWSVKRKNITATLQAREMQSRFLSMKIYRKLQRLPSAVESYKKFLLSQGPRRTTICSALSFSR